MPKSSKVTKSANSATTPPEETSTTTAAGPKVTPKAKPTKSARGSSATKTAAKKRAAKPSVKAGAPPDPSDADIRLRAYFIAERRVQLALQGDPAKDWLEAKRQLEEETRQGI